MFLLLLMLSFSSTVFSLTGYDCKKGPLNMTSFSLVSVEPCPYRQDKIQPKEELIQLIQFRRSNLVQVRQCLIEVTRHVMRCSWLNDAQMVPHGYGSYFLHISQESCLEIHQTGTYQYDPQTKISDIQPNSSTSASVLLAGSLKASGSCSGEYFRDRLGDWEDVVVQAEIKIIIKDFYAPIDTKSSKLLLPSGHTCDVHQSTCFDLQGGHTFWSMMNLGPCNDNPYDVLYEGLAEVRGLTGEVDHRKDRAVYTVSEGDILFALATQGITTVCYQEAYYTEHPKLMIVKSKSGIFAQKRSPLAIQNTDLLTYINTKFVFLNQHLADQMEKLYRTVLSHECQLLEDSMKYRLMLARIAPNEFAYLQGGGPGYTALLSGEVAYLIKCEPVPVAIRATSTCYQDIPVSYNNQSFFMSPRNRVLMTHSAETTCSDLAPMMAQLDNAWYSLGKTVRAAKPPMTLETKFQQNWNYYSPRELAIGGIYDQEAIEALSDHIMYPMELPAIKDTLARTVTYIDLDRQGLNYERLIEENTMNNISKRVWNKLWGWFGFLGQITSGLLGLLIAWKIIKMLIGTIINILMLHDAFGLSWKMACALFDGITHLLLHKERRQNKAPPDIRESDSLTNVISPDNEVVQIPTYHLSYNNVTNECKVAKGSGVNPHGLSP